MISCENHVGRLVEVRVLSPFSGTDIETLEARVASLATRLTERRVSCADLRDATVLPKEAAGRALQVLSRELANVERSALILSSTSPMLALQLNRFVRTTGSGVRRTFEHATDAMSWLGEVLTPEESARLRTFLIEDRVKVLNASGGQVRQLR